ncbi:uncharacterized protein PSFLO_04816 [Pseudozyma flocculosa]|uniref:Uncharacterized protein n=1 Tax=Pseudozyma flocculosa TaxID=84751 RepID=A0A5C3F664_9BASI|nr:uncharacterized protein PSFLO_04816 [Pseudozyma flocculosa]
MSPLRRSARAAAAAASATSPPPPVPSPQASPSKPDRKRKRGQQPEAVQEAQPAAAAAKPSASSQPESASQASRKAASTTVNGDAAADGPSQSNGAPSSTSESKDRPAEAEVDVADPPSEFDEYRALLGISRAAVKSHDEGAKGIRNVDRYELKLLDADAIKLKAVLSSLAPELLTAKRSSTKARQANGAAGGGKASQRGDKLPFANLEEAFTEGTRLRDLREHLLSLRMPLLEDARLLQELATEPLSDGMQHQNKEVEEKRSTLCSLTLILSLVDQLARRYRETDDQGEIVKGDLLASLVEARADALEARRRRKAVEGQARIKAEPTDDELLRDGVASIESGQAPGQYALHMRLPRGDFFSKPVHLDSEALGKIDPDFKPEPRTQGLRRDANKTRPTLGERSVASRAAKRQHRAMADAPMGAGDGMKPVMFLRYGNYASFAPSHDSTAATMSHTASRDQTVSEPPRLQLAAPASEANEDELQLDGLDQSLDAQAIKAGLAQLEKDEKISAQLQRNLILLKELQEAQWDRLRRSFRPKPAKASPSSTAASKRRDPSKDGELEPSAEEETIAAALLDSLASLIALQPHAADVGSGTMLNVLPGRSTISNFSRTIGAIDPTLSGQESRSDYWGTLDDSLYQPGARYPGVRAGPGPGGSPLLIRSNSTVRLNHGGGASAAWRGELPPATLEKGKGMLEKFASSRLYSDREDRHEIELLSAEAQPGARRPLSPEKMPGGGYPQRAGSGGPHATSSPSATHASAASPAVQSRAQPRQPMPPAQQPQHPQQPQHHPVQQQQQQQHYPGTPARYPPGGHPSSSYAHPPNGVSRQPLPQQQPGPAYQQAATSGVRSYGPPSAPSASPSVAPGGGLSYAYASPAPPARSYGYNPTTPQPTASYPTKVVYPASASPSKSYAYPAPVAHQAGGYPQPADWAHQQQQARAAGQLHGGGGPPYYAQGHAMSPQQQHQQLHAHQHHRPQQPQPQPQPHGQQQQQHYPYQAHQSAYPPRG